MTSERQIRKIFRRDLLRLAELYQAAGQSPLDPSPDAALASYYKEPEVRKMTKADFEAGGAGSADGLEASLRALWADEAQQQAFYAFAASVARVTPSLRATEEQTSDVSQFVYVMY